MHRKTVHAQQPQALGTPPPYQPLQQPQYQQQQQQQQQYSQQQLLLQQQQTALPMDVLQDLLLLSGVGATPAGETANAPQLSQSNLAAHMYNNAQMQQQIQQMQQQIQLQLQLQLQQQQQQQQQHAATLTTAATAVTAAPRTLGPAAPTTTTTTTNTSTTTTLNSAGMSGATTQRMLQQGQQHGDLWPTSFHIGGGIDTNSYMSQTQHQGASAMAGVVASNQSTDSIGSTASAIGGLPFMMSAAASTAGSGAFHPDTMLAASHGDFQGTATPLLYPSMMHTGHTGEQQPLLLQEQFPSAKSSALFSASSESVSSSSLNGFGFSPMLMHAVPEMGFAGNPRLSTLSQGAMNDLHPVLKTIVYQQQQQQQQQQQETHPLLLQDHTYRMQLQQQQTAMRQPSPAESPRWSPSAGASPVASNAESTTSSSYSTTPTLSSSRPAASSASHYTAAASVDQATLQLHKLLEGSFALPQAQPVPARSSGAFPSPPTSEPLASQGLPTKGTAAAAAAAAAAARPLSSPPTSNNNPTFSAPEELYDMNPATPPGGDNEDEENTATDKPLSVRDCRTASEKRRRQRLNDKYETLKRMVVPLATIQDARRPLSKDEILDHAIRKLKHMNAALDSARESLRISQTEQASQLELLGNQSRSPTVEQHTSRNHHVPSSIVELTDDVQDLVGSLNGQPMATLLPSPSPNTIVKRMPSRLTDENVFISVLETSIKVMQSPINREVIDLVHGSTGDISQLFSRLCRISGPWHEQALMAHDVGISDSQSAFEQFYTFSHAHWFNPTVRRLWSQVQLLTYCPSTQLAIAPSSDGSTTTCVVPRRTPLTAEQIRAILVDIHAELASPRMHSNIVATMAEHDAQTGSLSSDVDRLARLFLPVWLDIFRKHGMRGEAPDIATFQAAAYAIDDPVVVELTWTISRYGFVLYCRDLMRTFNPHQAN
ncbi:hypothetical protein CAOG_006480 [Capsaspora owczarzaki ATCC 30864]|uniref:BHLH domain-containing protein n=2 Tax=Capsaspora owczarzaki (strain ATCC 30864) TaxID=595528 RepID=A0A0D2UM25_CAPO3|nr:hypothetical protein CAOG_006480 [Capsaspora owczarzaki ATCC 30864]